MMIKEKFVERFDTKCVETLEQNGVVSRTVAWDAIQGIENPTNMASGNDESPHQFSPQATTSIFEKPIARGLHIPNPAQARIASPIPNHITAQYIVLSKAESGGFLAPCFFFLLIFILL